MDLGKLVFNEYEGKDISIYATAETIDEFIDTYDIELENEEDYGDCIKNGCAILSKIECIYGREWYIDKLPINKRNQIINECDVLLVERELDDKDIIDYSNIDFNESYIFIEDVKSIEEYESDWLDDVVEDLFNELDYAIENNECCHCAVKRILKAVINCTKEDVINDIINYLEN